MKKIYFVTRRDLLKNPAGDTIQVLKTKEYLTGLGVDVQWSSSPDQEGEGLYHFFNLNRARDLLLTFESIQKKKARMVLSPIYWSMEEYLSRERPQHLAIWYQDRHLRKKLLSEAHLLLPNGWGELNILRNDFGEVDLFLKTVVVPNGVDPLFFNPSPKPFIEEYGITDFILCVGRISRRKNQLALIRAMKGLSIPLVLIGHVNDPLYFRLCRENGEEVLFLPHLPQEILKSAYAAAKVHVLCSFFDTPGLVALEAALAGCNIVTTRIGTGREYFQDHAWYCDPHSIPSIKQALLKAYASPFKRDLQKRIMNCYSWEVVAKKTCEAYQKLL